jgi:hypothetical protein
MHTKHYLHANDREWPQSNCSVDLWIEVLHHWGFDPVSAMAFTVALDYEGDQFTFYKIPPGDLESLYNVQLLELSVFDDLEQHVVEQVKRGRIVLVEQDGFYLPDTKGITYRAAHKKTTIGVNSIDPTNGTLTYFHNDIFGTLDGEDYQHVMYKADPPVLFPYTEFIKRHDMRTRSEVDYKRAALLLLQKHMIRMPQQSPVAAFRRAFAAHVHKLNPVSFHEFAFNHFRMFGSNFEYLGSFLKWLTGDHVQACTQLAKISKLMQFKTLRMVSREKFDPLDEQFNQLEENYARLVVRIKELAGRSPA